MALLAALVFLGPRLLNTKAVRDLAVAELERQDRGSPLLRPGRGHLLPPPTGRDPRRRHRHTRPGGRNGRDPPGGPGADPPAPRQRPQRRHPAGRPGRAGADPREAEARKSVLRGGVRGEPLFPPRHAAGKRAGNGRHGAERAPRTLGRGQTDRVPERTECPGRLSAGTDDASAPLHVPVLGTSFDRVEPAPGGASRGHPCGDGGVPGPRFRRTAGPGRRPLARRIRSFPFAAESKRKGSGRFRSGRR